MGRLDEKKKFARAFFQVIRNTISRDKNKVDLPAMLSLGFFQHK